MEPLFTKEQLEDHLGTKEVESITNLNQYIKETEDDLERMLRTQWWPNQDRSNFGFEVNNDYYFDFTKVDRSSLKNAAIYYCIYQYILPKLTRFTEGDAIFTKLKYYENKFDIEWADVKEVLIYDWDSDGDFEETERYVKGRRLHW